MADKNLTLTYEFVNELLDLFSTIKNTLEEYKEYIQLVNETGLNISKTHSNPSNTKKYIKSVMKGDAYLAGLTHIIEHQIPDCMSPFMDYPSKTEE